MHASNRWNLPYLGLGLGLRSAHYPTILRDWPELDWFEVLSENYLFSAGRQVAVLDRIAQRYPVALHGVSLSIGSSDPLDFEYLGELKRLAERTQCKWLGDHLCWTGVAGRTSHDLLPLPYTEAVLRHVVERVRQVQDFLERPLVLENASSYLEFHSSSMGEQEFLARMAEEADCALLLDVNNVYVSCCNHGWDPQEYLAAIPADRVVQVHLAGHLNKGTHIVDTHGGAVIDEVWELYRAWIQRTGPVSTLLEWDTEIPSFEIACKELHRAKEFGATCLARG